MKHRNLYAVSTLLLSTLCLVASPAYAYIGPGAGLTAIGAFLAVAAAIFVAIFGFLWYPIKRMLRKRKSAAAPQADTPAASPSTTQDDGNE